MSGIINALVASLGATGNNISFVGGSTGVNASSRTPTVSLTGLSGGADSSPSGGHLVIVAIAHNSSTDFNITCTTSGYTEVADLYSSGTAKSQLAVYYKVLTSNETSVSFDLGTTTVSSFVIHVWSGINSTPLDSTSTTTTATGANPNPPSITTATNNSFVIAIGSLADTSPISAITSPSGMSNFFQSSSGLSGLQGIAIASIKRTTSGAYDPPAFGGGNDDPSNAVCAVTMAIKSS